MTPSYHGMVRGTDYVETEFRFWFKPTFRGDGSVDADARAQLLDDLLDRSRHAVHDDAALRIDSDGLSTAVDGGAGYIVCRILIPAGSEIRAYWDIMDAFASYRKGEPR
jgi:hypothetical protein